MEEMEATSLIWLLIKDFMYANLKEDLAMHHFRLLIGYKFCLSNNHNNNNLINQLIILILMIATIACKIK
jgi:hypothetical protein